MFFQIGVQVLEARKFFLALLGQGNQAPDLETTYKIVDILKDIVTIDAMHKSDREKYSGWDGDYSYSRGRDNRRYRSSNDDLIDHLTDMMRSARTDEERENYRKTIDQLTR